MMQSEWPVGDASTLKAMKLLTMIPTPKRWLSVDGFQEQMRVKPKPYSWRLPSSANQTTLRATMSILRQESSCAVRAKQHLWQLLLVLSSMVLTFKQLSSPAFWFCFHIYITAPKISVNNGKPTGYGGDKLSLNEPFLVPLSMLSRQYSP